MDAQKSIGARELYPVDEEEKILLSDYYYAHPDKYENVYYMKYARFRRELI